MKPSAAPEGHGPHHINVEWAMPPASIRAAEFECQYGFQLLGKWSTHQRGLTDDPTTEARRIEPLKPNEKYIVRVRARFEGRGWGPWSPKSKVMATLPEGATPGSSPTCTPAMGGQAPAVEPEPEPMDLTDEERNVMLIKETLVGTDDDDVDAAVNALIDSVNGDNAEHAANVSVQVLAQITQSSSPRRQAIGYNALGRFGMFGMAVPCEIVAASPVFSSALRTVLAWTSKYSTVLVGVIPRPRSASSDEEATADSAEPNWERLFEEARGVYPALFGIARLLTNNSGRSPAADSLQIRAGAAQCAVELLQCFKRAEAAVVAGTHTARTSQSYERVLQCSLGGLNNMATFAPARQPIFEANAYDLLLHFARGGGSIFYSKSAATSNVPVRAAMAAALLNGQKGSAGVTMAPEVLEKVLSILKLTLDGEALNGTRYVLWKVGMAVAELSTNDQNKPALLASGVVSFLTQALSPATIKFEMRRSAQQQPSCFREACRRLAFAKGIYNERLAECSSLNDLPPDILSLIFPPGSEQMTSVAHVMEQFSLALFHLALTEDGAASISAEPDCVSTLQRVLADSHTAKCEEYSQGALSRIGNAQRGRIRAQFVDAGEPTRSKDKLDKLLKNDRKYRRKITRLEAILKQQQMVLEDCLDEGEESEAEECREGITSAKADLRAAKNQMHENSSTLRSHIAFIVHLTPHFPELLELDTIKSFMASDGLMDSTRRLADYDKLRPLYQARHQLMHGQIHSKEICLKKLPLDDSKTVRRYMKDIRSVQQLKHPFVISYAAVFEDSGNLFLQMDFHQHGSLRQWIASSSPELSIRRTILRQVLLGIDYIHASGIIHCDIKGENVLITDALTPLLCDFDMSIELDTGPSSSVSVRSTFGFIAPEVLPGYHMGKQPPSRASDVYAFGVLMLNTVHPPEDRKYPSLDISAADDPALKSIVSATLTPAPNKRPTTAELQSDPYFAVDTLDEWGRVDIGQGFSSKRSCKQELLAAGDALGIPNIKKVVSEIDERMNAHGAMDQREFDHRFAFFLYTMQSQYCSQGQQPYDVFNAALRMRGGDTFDAWRPYLWHLMQALSARPDEARTLYRGLDAPNLAAYDATRRVHWSGFSSASIHPKIAKRFAGSGVVFKLSVQSAKDVQPFSWFGNMEGELLLSPNMEFLVTKELHTPTEGPLAGCRCIEMQQIPDDTLWS